MEPITLTAIALFLAPYISKGGEKLAEKTIEAVFDSRSELADKFKGLFSDEIISLDLTANDSDADIESRLDEKPALRRSIESKISQNSALLLDLVEAIKSMPDAGSAAVLINAEKIAQINYNSQNITQNIENF